MAFTEKYVSHTGSGTNTGLSEANAMTWAQMVTDINATLGTGCRYNIKATGTYSISSGNDMGGVGGSTASPIVLRGYKTTPGDGYLGRDATGALITTNMPLIHYTSNGSLRTFKEGVIESLNVLASARDDFAISLNYKMGLIGCRVENSYNNSSSGAVRMEEATVVFECDLLMTGGGGSGRAIVELTGQIIRLDSCRVTTTTANGIGIKGSYGCGLFGCLIKGPGTGSGIYFDGSNPCCNLRNNTIVGWTDGVKFNNSVSEHPNWICGNMITDCAGYGVNFTTTSMESIIGPNRTRDNALGDTNNAAQNWLQAGRIIPLVTTDTGGPTSDYVNPATNDYNLIPASPGKGVNVPKISDMGAYGLPDPAGGGGGTAVFNPLGTTIIKPA